MMYMPGCDFKYESEVGMDKLGKTGDFPRGKLNEDDEGGLQIGLAVDGGCVIIDFGTPVSWLGIDPDCARKLAANIIKIANMIDGKS